jgi:hypothetical protein
MNVSSDTKKTKTGLLLIEIILFCLITLFFISKNEARNTAPPLPPVSDAPLSNTSSAPPPIIPKKPPDISSHLKMNAAPRVSLAAQNAATPPVKWGFYVHSGDPQKILELEQTLGKSPDHIAVFIHWGNENKFPFHLAPVIKDRGKTLIIFWEATDYTVGTADQPRFSYDAILRGDWDAYITSFAADAKNYNAPIVLIPFSEMNGDWFPWSGTKNGNTPEKAILAYRHLHDMFAGVLNVKFGFAPNNDSVPNMPENSLNKYYPGDAYVDIVGVNGFNFSNPWQTFDEMFGAPLAVLSAYDKPIYIFSFASAAGANKATWITDTFTKDIIKHPKIAGWIWFNENKERDWRVDSDPISLAAFKAILP